MVQELQRQLVQAGVQADINSMADSLGRLAQNQADASGNAGLSQSRTNLRQHVASVSEVPMPLAWIHELEDLGWDDLLPTRLLDATESVLQGNEMTPGIALPVVDQLRRRLATFTEALQSTTTGLTKLEVSPRRLQPGECALQMLIPRSAHQAALDGLQRDLRDMGTFLTPFQEMASGGSVESPTVISLESSDFGILVLINQLDVAANVADLLSRLMQAFDHIRRWRELWKESRDIPFGEDIEADMERRSEDHMNQAIEDIVSRVIDAQTDALARLPLDRRAEVKTHLKVSVNLAKSKIAAGYGLDVLIEPPTSASANESNTESSALREQIQLSRRPGGYRLGPGETYPPLALEDSEDDSP